MSINLPLPLLGGMAIFVKVVVTGSYNPTASGTLRNRENVLIIHSPVVAAEFLAEYAVLQ